MINKYTLVDGKGKSYSCVSLHSKLEDSARNDKGIVYVQGHHGPPEAHSFDIDGIRVDLIPSFDEGNVEIHAETEIRSSLIAKRLEDTLNINLKPLGRPK
mgnify:CR=1 FL=1